MPDANIKLLVVEDELITALDIKLCLLKSGYNVIGIARNEDEVKKIMKKDTPDIVLMDVNLSKGRTGIEIAEELIKSGIRVYFITAQKDKSTREKIENLQAKVFDKPIRVEMILRELQKAFE